MKRLHGFTLIELLMFILVVSLALAGVLAVFNRSSMHNADPQLRRQALAIAESLLDEVQLMPFTYCEPTDPNVASATMNTATFVISGCTTLEAIGPEVGETRYANPQFDNVNDYHGFVMNGISTIAGTAVAGLEKYQASVSVAAGNLSNITAASGSALRITVTVTDPNGEQTVLEGWRTRYAPNAAF